MNNSRTQQYIKTAITIIKNGGNTVNIEDPVLIPRSTTESLLKEVLVALKAKF